jgi:hypothetical protein
MSIQTLIEFIDNWRLNNGVASTETQRLQLATELHAQVATLFIDGVDVLPSPGMAVTAE